MIKHILNGHIKFYSSLLIIFIFFPGCESDKDKNVTGSLFYRKPGDFESITIDPDSISVATTYKYRIGEVPYTLAGRYKNATAFSVFKFSKPGQSILDSLVTAKFKANISEVWRGGDLEFGLYNATSDWSDTTRLNPGRFLTDIADTISAFSDTSSTLSSLIFNLNTDIFDSWSEYGTYLIKNTDAGEAMVSLYSDNSTSIPFMELVTENAYGSRDTTTVRCIEGAYYFNTDVDTDNPILSNGDATGFVLNIKIPDFISPPVAINECVLTLFLKENLIVTEEMAVTISRLTEEFTTIEDAETDYDSSIDLKIKPDVNTYNIDISNYINAWHNLKEPTYGILFKPVEISKTPNYAVIEPSDSLDVKYTTLPEVE